MSIEKGNCDQNILYFSIQKNTIVGITISDFSLQFIAIVIKEDSNRIAKIVTLIKRTENPM